MQATLDPKKLKPTSRKDPHGTQRGERGEQSAWSGLSEVSDGPLFFYFFFSPFFLRLILA